MHAWSAACVCTYLQTRLEVDRVDSANPPYLLSQCKYQSLAPPLSCCELHSAFSSTRLVSSRSCASFSPQGCTVDIPEQLQPSSSTSHSGGLSPLCYCVIVACLALALLLIGIWPMLRVLCMCQARHRCLLQPLLSVSDVYKQGQVSAVCIPCI